MRKGKGVRVTDSQPLRLRSKIAGGALLDLVF